MREVVNTFAQLAAIIMIVITLAVSSAAISQWVRGGAATAETAPNVEAAMPIGTVTQLSAMAAAE